MTPQSDPHEKARQWFHSPLSRISLKGPEKADDRVVFPSACRAAPDGTLYLVDEIGHKVLVYSAGGILKTVLGGKGNQPGQFHYPTDIAFGPEGDLCITDRWNHRVQVFDADGRLKFVFGKAGAEPGEMLEPYGIAFFDGNLVISERENERLSVFSPLGEFKRNVRKPFGADALPYPAGLAAVGRFLVALTSHGTALVLDRRFCCENVIPLGVETAHAEALYAAGADTFLLSAEPGLLILYGIDGSKIWTKKPEEVSPETGDTGATGRFVMALVTSISRKSFAVVRMPAPPMSLPEIYEAISPDMMQRCRGSDTIFYSRLAAGIPTSPCDRPAGCFTDVPPAFVCACFQSALNLADKDPDAARPLLLQYLAKFPAISGFHELLQAHPGAPQDIKDISRNNAVRLTETLPLNIPDIGNAYIAAAARAPDGDFVLSRLQLGGLIRFGRGRLEWLSTSEPKLCVVLLPLPDGTYLAWTWDKMLGISHIASDGRVIRTLLECSPKFGEMRHSHVPCVRDVETFYFPNTDTGQVEIHSISEGRIGVLGGEQPLVFSEPVGVAHDAAHNALYVLQSDSTIIAVEKENEIRARLAPDIFMRGYSYCFITLLSDGNLISFVTPENPSEAGCKRLAKICSKTGRILFMLSSFDISENGVSEVEVFKNVSAVVPEPDGGFWALDMYAWRLYKFRVGS